MYCHVPTVAATKMMYVYEHQSVTRFECVFYNSSKRVNIMSGQCH